MVLLVSAVAIAYSVQRHKDDRALAQTANAHAKAASQVKQADATQEAALKQTIAAAKKNTETKTGTQSSTAPTSTDAKNVTKYSTSSDPRSTAYSLTPPAANPASSNTKITHAGQLKAGDMVYYNATKGEKGYYAGDLVISRPIITISRNGGPYGGRFYDPNVTVSSPDGHVMSFPTSPWDSTSPYFVIAAEASKYKNTGTSFDMYLQVKQDLPANGSYQMHVYSGQVGTGSPYSWQYDGFITVIVTD